MVESKIVEAVGAASATLSKDPSMKRRSVLIQEAMSEAVQKCFDEGIPLDSPVVKARMLAARQMLLDGK